MKIRLSCVLVFGDHASNPSGAIRVPSIFSLSSQKANFSSQNQPTGLKKKKTSAYNYITNTTRRIRWDLQGPLKIVVCTMME